MMSTERCKRQRKTETGKGFLKAAAAVMGPALSTHQAGAQNCLKSYRTRHKD